MKKWAYPLALATFFIFIGIALNINNPSFLSFDDKMASLLRGNSFFLVFHHLGEPKFIVAVAIVMSIYLWVRKRNYRGMLLIILTFAVGNSLNQSLKLYFARPRPEIIDQLTSFSFPSGHSQMSILYLLTLAYLFSEMLSNKKKIRILWIAAILLVCFIGLSRIAGDRHFATDVIAGWSIGYTWFIICILWYESRKRAFNNMSS
ncbi:MAG: phosphatase PAP2 family protein [Solibacillus sp.]|uniref:phosphatase PAP2 family protein n=1 Tax=unclassified Solibacillus TaxID=2637870 RepID=UPI0030F933C7